MSGRIYGALLDAIEYADDARHSGAGYTLMVSGNGGCIEVKVMKALGHDRYEFATVCKDEKPIFFTPANIVSVQVLW